MAMLACTDKLATPEKNPFYAVQWSDPSSNECRNRDFGPSIGCQERLPVYSKVVTSEPKKGSDDSSLRQTVRTI